jgi:uncharacterized protein with HEPN domain
MKEDALRMAEMFGAIEQVRSYISGGSAAFFRGPKTSDAVAYELLKLGEAAKQVSATLRRAHPEVPWKRLISLRNEMIHEYFRTDLQTLWPFVTRELDTTERALRRVSNPTKR